MIFFQVVRNEVPTIRKKMFCFDSMFLVSSRTNFKVNKKAQKETIMSDVMRPTEFENLINWIIEEYKKKKTIFGISEEKFYRKPDDSAFDIFGEKCETALGPAAGPHTQSTQNIVAAFLTGGRFFELKTVQILDELDIEKPCIEAADEGYNTEWSTELKVSQAYKEYVKAWFLLHLLNAMLQLSDDRKFVFNMSVGYDLEGIKSAKIDKFIEDLKDASHNKFFLYCKQILKNEIKSGKIPNLKNPDFVEKISANISNSITLSTMHGCPPEDQEEICKYLMKEKRLHTFVKLNPTLHGYEYVKNIFTDLGFDHITLKEESFTHDMQYDAAVQMLRTLLAFSRKQNVQFGVKLSNTLAVVNDKGKLPTDEMYMSGRALFPLTINLADKLNKEFGGKLPISYAGGASYFNVKEIFRCGIRPITMATDLLKPGGYARLKQMAELLDEEMKEISVAIDSERLSKLAKNSLSDEKYRRDFKSDVSLKIEKKLEMTDCFIAPCEEACPIHQDVPEYVRLINEKRYREAYELIISKNPLPFITGFICDHKCQLKCVRNDYEEPVLIRDLKRVAAENGYREGFLNSEKLPKIQAKVAIIGAGPAGMSSAYFLALAGFEVTIFEKTAKAGGTVMHIIPDFRLPNWAIEKDIELIKSTGVKFKMNIGANFDLEKLRNDGFKYINLAIGAAKPGKISIAGEQGIIVDALDFLREFNADKQALKIGKNVAVIGGGNSAMDAARAALRIEGVEKVHIVYRRTKREMPADREELDFALNEGVIFQELLNPISLKNGILECQKMKLGEQDKSGRRRPLPIPDEYFGLKIDFVITAVGEKVDVEILHKNGIKFEENGKIKSDKYLETNLENVFISGDAARGPATVVEAIADGRKVAERIISKEKAVSPQTDLQKYKFDYNRRLREVISKKSVIKTAALQLENETEIREESFRCLECNFVCNKCVEVCPNRANVAVKIPGFKDENQILHLDALCNECGNCETFCPYDGAPYKDKFTLFGSEEDFSESKNDGFLLLSENENVKFKMRLHNSEFILDFEQNGNLKELKTTSKIADRKELDAMIMFIWYVYRNENYLFV